MTDDVDALARLDELYAQLPTVECVGQCWNSCGPIAMSGAERRRIAALGVDIPVFTDELSERWRRDEPLHCPALTAYKQCSVYEARPLVCRVFGTGRGEMACQFGCKVTGDRLRGTEVLRLIARSYRLGGAPDGDDDFVLDDRVFDDPVVAEMFGRYMGGQRSVRPQLEDAIRAAYARL